MAIKAGEVGKIFRYATYFNLAAATDLEIKITGPGGEVIVPTARVATLNQNVSDPDLGELTANTYMLFETIVTDFPVSGTYTVCGRYTDDTPKIFYGDIATVIVEGSCYA